jgi:hypothetical protein
MRRKLVDVETDAMLLWEYVSVNDDPFRCEARDALGFSDHQIRGFIRYLRDIVGEDVILPTGMSHAEPHENPTTGNDCRCGRLRLNYKVEVAKGWYKRRLVTVRGHANEIEKTGEKLQEQFPKSVIMARLTSDARRLHEDIDLALSWLGGDG